LSKVTCSVTGVLAGTGPDGTPLMVRRPALASGGRA
jgi:hypothetical protein